LTAALLFGGGSALAQADLIVDPWARVLASKAVTPREQAALPPNAPGRARHLEVESPIAPVTAARPGIEPSGPLVETTPDPWVTREPASRITRPGASPEGDFARRPLEPNGWARVVPEIIDPWGPERLAVYRDPLILDPWAN
jgi:hypothetical protein